MQPDSRWRFFTDQVMGGRSTGTVAFLSEAGLSFARMTGHVSTANRGGFIQMRFDLPTPLPEATKGLRLIVRGNTQRYFVHLRSGGSLPWQYYQAGFDVTESWDEVRLPLANFAPAGGLAGPIRSAGSLTSVAVAAYGRDYDAQIDLRDLEFI